MPTIHVPYHLDESLPADTLPAPAHGEVTTVAPELPDGDIWDRMAALHEDVADRVALAVRDGATPTVMSGDCMVALGTITGVQRAGVDPGIVWFDAHGDLQTLETTTSGYLGGIPLRVAVGYRPELSADRLGLRAVPQDRVVLVDARDLDPPEAEFLATSSIRHVGVDEVTEAVLPAGPLLLHVDLDVVDSAELDGLLFPTPDGPSLPAVLAAARRVLATGRVAALSLGCTWHPGQDDAGVRARLIADLVGGR